MKGAKQGTAYALTALALSLIVPHASPAQIVIGGDEPDVTVNWGVLDHLGQPPTLPGMLLGRPSAPPASVRSEERAEQKVIYHRAATPAAPRPKHHPKAVLVQKPAAVTPASDKEEVPAPSAHKAAPAPERTAEDEPVAKAPPKTEPDRLPEAALPPPVKAAPVPETKPAAPPPPPAIAETKPQPAPETAAATPVAPAPAAPTPAAQPPSAPAVQAPVSAAPPPPAPQPLAPPQIATAVPPPVHTATGAAAGVYHRGDVLTVLFKPNDSALPDAAQAELTALAQKMSRDESLGLQLVAFAQGDEASTSKARRLSLSRALEVRKVLMDLGVRSTRIEVRALGNKNDSTDSPDRVDAILTVH